MAMNRIPGENIYIGGFMSLKNKAALSRANITHVVSVLRMQHPDETFAPFKHLVIAVDDVGDENLLEHFATANAFIQSGLDAGGGVLVHCAMGKSRSATICIAYLLHRERNALTPQDALAILRKARPLCEPNEGFMEQLSLYHKMGCPDDVTKHPLYQRWLYHREVEESVACGRAPEISTVLFEDEQPLAAHEAAESTTEIKCRKCRRTLATSSFIVPHEQQNQGQQKKAKVPAAPECAHIFLHPLTWMRPSLFPSSYPPTHSDPSPPSNLDSHSEDAPLSGRLICPNTVCGSNVGKFAWQGMQCSCGKWVVPAIGVAKSRVDVVNKAAKGSGAANPRLGAMGIRLPPGMRATSAEETEAGQGRL
ncbi:hypothetical protein VTN02DRAFT_73 [Thermoascus thermophilus]